MHGELFLFLLSGRYKITKFVKNKKFSGTQSENSKEDETEVGFEKYRAKNDYKFHRFTFRTIQKYDFKSSSLIPRKVTGSHTIFIKLQCICMKNSVRGGNWL